MSEKGVWWEASRTRWRVRRGEGGSEILVARGQVVGYGRVNEFVCAFKRRTVEAGHFAPERLDALAVDIGTPAGAVGVGDRLHVHDAAAMDVVVSERDRAHPRRCAGDGVVTWAA